MCGIVFAFLSAKLGKERKKIIRNHWSRATPIRKVLTYKHSVDLGIAYDMAAAELSGSRDKMHRGIKRPIDAARFMAVSTVSYHLHLRPRILWSFSSESKVAPILVKGEGFVDPHPVDYLRMVAAKSSLSRSRNSDDDIADLSIFTDVAHATTKAAPSEERVRREAKIMVEPVSAGGHGDSA